MVEHCIYTSNVWHLADAVYLALRYRPEFNGFARTSAGGETSIIARLSKGESPAELTTLAKGIAIGLQEHLK